MSETTPALPVAGQSISVIRTMQARDRPAEGWLSEGGTVKRLTVLFVASMALVAVVIAWLNMDSGFSALPECVQGAPVDGECAQ